MKSLKDYPRICFVGGSPAHYTRAFHRELEKILNDKIHFIYILKDKPPSDRSYEKGEYPDRCSILNFHDWNKIWKLANNADPDIIIMAGHYPRLILICTLWSVVKGKKSAYFSDTNIFDIQRSHRVRNFTHTSFYKIYFRFIHYFLYIGRRNKEFYQLINKRREKKINLFKLPYPALVKFTNKVKDIQNKKLHILYLGRLINLKNIDYVLTAISLLSEQEQHKILFTIAGDGPESPRLRQMAKILSITSSVNFTGSIPSDDVHHLFAKNDVLILPSSREPWGLVVNEALAAGLPVIAPYWVGSVADLVIDGISGFVMKDNKPETICETIQKVIKIDKGNLIEMGKKGRELVIDGDFHLEGAKSLFFSFLEEVSD